MRMGSRCVEVLSVAGIFESIPGEFEHEQNADQTEDNFGDTILNDECQTRQGDHCPGCIAYQRTQLDEQGRDKSTCGPAPNSFCGTHPGRRAECEGKDE